MEVIIFILFDNLIELFHQSQSLNKLLPWVWLEAAQLFSFPTRRVELKEANLFDKQNMMHLIYEPPIRSGEEKKHNSIFATG